MIYMIILFWILCFMVWFLNLPKVYINFSIEDLRKFLYVLLYRGYAEESIIYNGTLSIKTSLKFSLSNIDVKISAYKVRGKVHLFLVFSNKIFKKDIIYSEIKKRKLTSFILKLKKDVILIEFNREIDKIISFIEFIWKDILIENTMFDLYLFGDIEMSRNRMVYGRDIKELEEKGINVNIPVKKWQWVMWKLKHPRDKI